MISLCATETYASGLIRLLVSSHQLILFTLLFCNLTIIKTNNQCPIIFFQCKGTKV